MKITVPFTNFSFSLTKEATKKPYSYGAVHNVFQGVAGVTGMRINMESLFQFYVELVDVRKSVRKISNIVGKEGYIVENADDPTRDPDPKEKALVDALLNNHKLPFRELKFMWIRDRKVAGNCYWLLQKNANGTPIGVEIIDPRTMAVISNQWGEVISYVQQYNVHTPVRFDVDEIVHSVEEPSIKNALLGMSPIESIVWEAQTELAAQKSNYAFYENNAVPSHLLIVEDDLTEEQFEQLKENMNREHQGAENRFRAGLIPNVKDIKTISPSQKDMEYLASRIFNTKKIAAAMEVDPFILGYTEGVQRGNAEVIYRSFYQNTGRPEELLFEETVNTKLLPQAGITKVRIRIVESNYDNQKEQAEIARNDVNSGIITINEARKSKGLEPSDNDIANELMISGLPLDDLNEEIKEIHDLVMTRMEQKHKNLTNLINNEL